jgi:hypothetical protein
METVVGHLRPRRGARGGAPSFLFTEVFSFSPIGTKRKKLGFRVMEARGPRRGKWKIL